MLGPFWRLNRPGNRRPPKTDRRAPSCGYASPTPILGGAALSTQLGYSRMAEGAAALRGRRYRPALQSPVSRSISGMLPRWVCTRAKTNDAGQADMNLPHRRGDYTRGKFTTDDDGCIRFVSIKPAGYPIPTDGLVGKLLAAQGRHPFRPAHLHALARKGSWASCWRPRAAIHSDPRISTPWRESKVSRR